ncbi:MAG TPA: ammonia channel protein, partial [Hyphomicrobium sp.]|nr:ammonia channel protein [Hyphomicrobium sp.]
MKESLFSRSTLALAAGLALALVAGPGFAQEVVAPAAPAAAAEPALSAGDTAWMLTSAVLVLMMAIPGLALFYAGMTRKKNVLNTGAMVFAAVCLLSVTWMVAGYSIAFGDGGALNAYMGGFDKVMLGHLTKDAMSGTIPESLFIVFQLTFFALTPALIVGSIVERMKFSSLLIFLVLWSLIVYAPVCHWVWGGGFLSEDGVLDFAGGTVVHINSGVA